LIEVNVQFEEWAILIHMHRVFGFLTLFSPIILLAAVSATASPLQTGRAIAEANCARCHNLERTGDSPFAPAPPFRIISRMYKSSDLEEAFVEGIVVGHPAMPEFEMTGEQAAALAAFIDSLGN
jgi:mono/diheme cytochrome c family protein